MRVERRDYAQGTFTLQSAPWGFYHGARVMCSDGRLRRVKRIAVTADTFFSVPAAVTVKGRTVSGYVTVETVKGSSVETDDDPAMAKFIAYGYGKNANELPPASWRPNEVPCYKCEGSGRYSESVPDIACSYCNGRTRLSVDDDAAFRAMDARRSDS